MSVRKRRAPLISQRDTTSILKGAAAAGVQMSIVVRGDEVRFIPVDRISSSAAGCQAETDNALFLARIEAMGRRAI